MRTISDNQFKIGLFCANVSGGITKTLASSRWDSSWENNRRLAIQAEKAGIDFLLPLANWFGFGGDAPSEGETLETMTWAAGLMEATSTITIVVTLHAPFVHPLFAAKQLVTCDHIGRGRLALNIVSGSVPEEFKAFGIEMRPHEDRYAYTGEWLTIVKRLWSEDQPMDFAGQFFKLEGAISRPKPWGGTRPIIISAGSSPTGRAFAIENADCLFMLVVNIDKLSDEIRAIAGESEKTIDLYASGHMFCQATRKQTDEYYHYLVHENGDWAAAEFILRMHSANGSIPAGLIPGMRERFVSGLGTFLLKGDPDDVAAQYKRLADAGLAGIAVALPNYLDDFPMLRDKVLPRLERLGLRQPVAPAEAG